MAKDPLDPGTIDGLPRAFGRPVLDPERGPMTPAERKRRQRAGRMTVEFHLPSGQVATLDKLRGDLSRDEWLSSILKPKRKPKA